jgi:hypothetical protein
MQIRSFHADPRNTGGDPSVVTAPGADEVSFG